MIGSGPQSHAEFDKSLGERRHETLRPPRFSRPDARGLRRDLCRRRAQFRARPPVRATAGRSDGSQHLLAVAPFYGRALLLPGASARGGLDPARDLDGGAGRRSRHGRDRRGPSASRRRASEVVRARPALLVRALGLDESVQHRRSLARQAGRQDLPLLAATVRPGRASWGTYLGTFPSRARSNPPSAERRPPPAEEVPWTSPPPPFAGSRSPWGGSA